MPQAIFVHRFSGLRRLPGLLLLLATGFCSLATAADPEPRWYQVEVIVLAHRKVSDDERWRSDIALAYPPDWVALQAPETGQASAGTAASGAEKPGQRADAFHWLPESERELNRQAQAVRWSKDHRLLFHQAWRQSLQEESAAPAILISGGEAYGQHHELEGTLRLSVSRYLHLNTNLWFTEFAHNYGQDRGSWPPLPIRPDLRDYNALPSAQQPGLSDQLSQTRRLSQTESQSPWERLEPLPDEYERILSTPYIPRQIALMQQRRRMRSGETHYIDHPLIGIVILVTPFEPADKQDGASGNS